MNEPVTRAWAQYAGFWQPLAVGAAVWGGAVLVLLTAILVTLMRRP